MSKVSCLLLASGVNSKDLWDEIKLRVTSFIEQLQK